MRRLSPDEERLWAKVVQSVRPMRPRALEAPDLLPESPEPEAAPARPAGARARPAPSPAPLPPARINLGSTLDGSWDRRLARGLAEPDVVLDLHGHDLGTAYDLLDGRLEMAVASGARIMLLITGKPPRDASERPIRRGAIRAAVGDWLAASRHARNIAAVRAAHPRHGGTGALYIVLRRQR